MADLALVEGTDADAAALVAAGYVLADERERITTLWMSPEAQDALEAEALRQGRTMPDLGAEILTRALR